MKLEFNSEDFADMDFDLMVGTGDWGIFASQAAKRANARLQEMLAQCPVVYGVADKGKQPHFYSFSEGPELFGGRPKTHTARIVNIEQTGGKQ